MKNRVRITVLVVVVLTACLVWWLVPSTRARRAAERTRVALRSAGFKTEMEDFVLTAPPEAQARAEILTKAGQGVVDSFPYRSFELMKPSGSNAAIAMARQEKLAGEGNTDFWPFLQRMLEAHRAQLDQACAAANSGPNSFEPVAGGTPDLLLPLAMQRRALIMAIGLRLSLELHDRNHLAAWTNLQAVTRLAIAWTNQPFELSYSVSFGFVGIAERVAWEALHGESWSDEELAQLQREWERPDFFSGLAEATALTRAMLVAQCRGERDHNPPPRPPLPQIASDLALTPSQGWDELTGGLRHSRYRNHGSYDDERAILVYYRDRELEVRRATNSASWSEMRALPGITNPPPLSTIRGFAARPVFVSRQKGSSPSSRPRPSLLGRAAEAEARRRLVVTALALERYRLAHGSYPISLDKLAPELLPKTPTDFMDAKPLRYRRTGESEFMLYSTGLDCEDDGGEMRVETPQPGAPGRGFFRIEGPDLVWPRLATPEEVEADRRAQEMASARGRP